MSLEIKDLPAMRLACVLHTGPYNQVGSSFERLGRIAGPAGLFAAPGAAMMGIYKDDPATTPPERLRSAAALSVPESTTLPAGLVEDRVPAGKFACFVHVGPYDRLPSAWARMKNELVPASGHRQRPAISYEIYLNDPTHVKPAELRTEICIPIE